MGFLDAIRRRRDGDDVALPGQPSTQYNGPNEGIVVDFIDSLSRLSDADWRSVAAAYHRDAGWDAYELVTRSLRAAKRDTEANFAALLAEERLTKAVSAFIDPSGAVDDGIRAADRATTGAACALVANDLLPNALLEPLLAPFRGTHAVLPSA